MKDNPTNSEEVSKDSTAEVRIIIVDSNKQPPTIEADPQTYEISESNTNFATPLFHINAM